MSLSFFMILNQAQSSCMMVIVNLCSFSIESMASQYKIGRQSTISIWNVSKNRRKKQIPLNC
jgi:hypothetical protein